MGASRTDGWCVAPFRQTKGISLEAIANLTKLKVSTLQAIEDGDFDALPGGLYNISYIRQYARAIEADESYLVQFYRRKIKSPLEPVSNRGGEEVHADRANAWDVAD